MTSFTPGPWTLSGEVRRVGDTKHYCADICGPSDDGFWRGGVAYIQTADHLKHGMKIDEGKANAALIASAPDLLVNERKNLATMQATRARLREYGKSTAELDEAIRQTEAVIAKAEGRP